MTANCVSRIIHWSPAMGTKKGQPVSSRSTPSPWITSSVTVKGVSGFTVDGDRALDAHPHPAVAAGESVQHGRRRERPMLRVSVHPGPPRWCAPGSHCPGCTTLHDQPVRLEPNVRLACRAMSAGKVISVNSTTSSSYPYETMPWSSNLCRTGYSYGVLTTPGGVGPLDRRRQSDVSRALPVGVPVLVLLKVQTTRRSDLARSCLGRTAAEHGPDAARLVLRSL